MPKKPVKKPVAPKTKKQVKKPAAVKKTRKPTLTKEEKQQLAHTKIKLHEQTQEIKVQNKLSKKLEGKIDANMGLLSSPVIKNGINNNYAVVEKTYAQDEREVRKLKASGSASKETLQKAISKRNKSKAVLKKEQAIINQEIKQINQLNTKAKGIIRLQNNPGDVITVKDTKKIYAGKNMIFQALTVGELSIKKGSFNVILGPSGSGKTTLLNMISGLDRPTYGDIIVNGYNISALSNSQLTQFRRESLGFVFQSYNLLPSLNVNDNIEVGRSLQVEAHKKRDIGQLLEDINMGGNKKKKTYELSGGQQQRVSIARALSKAPQILIGDEPTGALDQDTSLKVFALFQEINKSQGVTVIIVTHNVNVAKLADQVIYVRNGKINKITQNKKPLQAKDMKEL